MKLQNHTFGNRTPCGHIKFLSVRQKEKREMDTTKTIMKGESHAAGPPP